MKKLSNNFNFIQSPDTISITLSLFQLSQRVLNVVFDSGTINEWCTRVSPQRLIRWVIFSNSSKILSWSSSLLYSSLQNETSAFLFAEVGCIRISQSISNCEWINCPLSPLVDCSLGSFRLKAVNASNSTTSVYCRFRAWSDRIWVIRSSNCTITPRTWNRPRVSRDISDRLRP